MSRKLTLPLFALFIFLTGIVRAQPLIVGDSTFSWVKVQVNIPDFFVLVDGKIGDFKLYSSGDSVQVPSGSHMLTIVGENISDYRTTYNVLPYKTDKKTILFTSFPRYPKSSYQVLKSKVTVRIYTDPESEIYVDDVHRGKNYTQLFLPPGKHNLHIIHPELGDLKKTIRTSYSEISEIYRYNTPPEGFSTPLKLIPGLGYLSQKRVTRAKITYGLFGGAVATWLVLNSKYNEKNESYKSALSLYNKAVTSETAIKYRIEANKYLDEMNSVNTKMKQLAIGTGLLYLITTIDGFIKPRSGYSYNPRLRARVNRIGANNYSELALRIDF